MTARIITGDCRDVLKTLDADSIDACVCDPPYDLVSGDRRDPRRASPSLKQRQSIGGFMGMHWDASGVAFSVETWEAVYRVLKPGAHLLSFGGDRTFHRMTCAIEDAGFEIRHALFWLHAQGFPKSHNLSGDWEGWGTALKPAVEIICMARKPLGKSTVAANVTAYGTGGLNIDGCRIEGGSTERHTLKRMTSAGTDGGAFGLPGHDYPERDERFGTGSPLGRWPANIILDEAAAALLDAQSGERRSGAPMTGLEPSHPGYGGTWKCVETPNYGDTGGGSRFFKVVKPDAGDNVRFRYTSKSSRAERNKGLEGMPEVVRNITEGHGMGPINTSKGDGSGIRENRPTANVHPTVKPVDLMQWLVRLVCPKGGTVIDPFTGSGSTGIAADREGMDFIGIEQDAEYAEIARRRIVGDCPLFAEVSHE